MDKEIKNTPTCDICQPCCPNVKIDKIEEGMTGKEVADLLYSNFDKLNKSKANKCVERKVRHLLKGENQIFNHTAKNKFVQEVFYVWSKKDVKNELDEFKDVADKVHDHLIDYNNPHKVTKAQVGLGNVDNTSDKDKPVSDATKQVIDELEDKVNNYKDTIDNYTINGYKISNNPTLDGNDIELDNYTKVTTDLVINADDTTTEAIGKLEYKLDKEIDDRTEAIQKEEEARIEKDNELQQDIDAVNSDLEDEINNRIENDQQHQQSIENLQTDLRLETAERQAEDEQLSDRIYKEVQDRENAIAAIYDNIEQEAAERKHADEQLQDNIDQEIADRTESDTVIQNNLTAHINDKNNPHEVTKAQVGLGNVTNDAQVKRAEMGVANGVATLNESGLVPSSQLPSYVDDVLEYNTLSAFPQVGEDGKIYVAEDTNLTYRWSGSQYIEISKSLALGETSSTAYAGDKGKANRQAIESLPDEIVTGFGTATRSATQWSMPTTKATKSGLNYGSEIAGTSITVPSATATQAGLMTAEDKSNLTILVGDGVDENTPSIGDITDNITNIENNINTIESNVSNIEQNIDNIEQDITDIQGDVNTIEGNINTINDNINTINDNIDTINNSINTINDNISEIETNIGDVSNLTTDADTIVEAINEHETQINQIKNYTVNGKAISTNPVLGATDIAIKDTLGYFDSSNVEDALQEVKQPLDAHLQNNTPGMKHIPSGGAANQILAWAANGTAKWENLSNIEVSTEDLLAYGVEWDTTVADPVLTRIGNTQLHKTLPIQSGMYGCICQGSVIRYRLSDEDWRFRREPITTQVTLEVSDGVITIKANEFNTKQYEKQWIIINDIKIQIDSIDTDAGAATLINNEYTGTLQPGSYTCELGSVRNGYDGTVKVYVPGFYIKSTSEGNKRRVYLSTSQIDSTYTYQPPVLVDAYKCTILNTVPTDMGYLSTLTVNSPVSIANTNAYCRGGNNNSSYDQYLANDPRRTQLGKPRTSITRANMRQYAKQVGAHIMSYEEYKNIFYWLYVVEYANFNSQETYNASLDDNGYSQGGLGSGVTTMNSNVWNGYNNYYPLTPCGYLDSVGNNSGIEPQVLGEFSMSITPTTSWSSWQLSTYRHGIYYSNKATVNRSGNTATITNVASSGEILYTSSLVAVGSATYTVSGLQSGQQVQFTCSGQTTQTLNSDGQITMDWGTDGAQTRYVRVNFTGECNISIVCNSTTTTIANYPSQSITVNRWRGFDNPFGDVWTNLDGVIIDADAANHANQMDYVYTCNTPEDFADTITDKYQKIAESTHSEGYVKAFDLGDTANIIASSVGGSATTYMCDHHWTGNADTSLRTLRVGGVADGGSSAGLGSLYSLRGVSFSHAYVGFRLVTPGN